MIVPKTTSHNRRESGKLDTRGACGVVEEPNDCAFSVMVCATVLLSHQLSTPFKLRPYMQKRQEKSNGVAVTVMRKDGDVKLYETT